MVRMGVVGKIDVAKRQGPMVKDLLSHSTVKDLRVGKKNIVRPE